jgi:hypothetical protein
MSRVAEGHFRRKRGSALDIEGKHVTIQGPSPDLNPASPFAPSARPPGRPNGVHLAQAQRLVKKISTIRVRGDE